MRMRETCSSRMTSARSRSPLAKSRHDRPMLGHGLAAAGGDHVVGAQGGDASRNQRIGIDQVHVAAVFRDALVKRRVPAGHGQPVAGILGPLHRADRFAQLPERLVAPSREAQAQRGCLHEPAKQADLGHVFFGRHEDKAAGLRPDLDEPLQLQHVERFAHRRAAHAQRGGQLQLRQCLTELELAVLDGRADALGDLDAQRTIGGARLVVRGPASWLAASSSG